LPPSRKGAGGRDVDDEALREVQVDGLGAERIAAARSGEPRIHDHIRTVAADQAHRAALRASRARCISPASRGSAYGPPPACSSAMIVSTTSSGRFWLSLRFATTRVGVRRKPTVPLSSREM